MKDIILFTAGVVLGMSLMLLATILQPKDTNPTYLEASKHCVAASTTQLQASECLVATYNIYYLQEKNKK